MILFGISFVRTHEVVHEIVNGFAENPGTSIRRASNALGIPKFTIHTTFKEEKFHPYEAQIISQLLPRDLPSRIAFG